MSCPIYWYASENGDTCPFFLHTRPNNKRTLRGQLGKEIYYYCTIGRIPLQLKKVATASSFLYRRWVLYSSPVCSNWWPQSFLARHTGCHVAAQLEWPKRWIEQATVQRDECLTTRPAKKEIQKEREENKFGLRAIPLIKKQTKKLKFRYLFALGSWREKPDGDKLNEMTRKAA